MSPKDDAGRLQRWVDGQPSGSLDGRLGEVFRAVPDEEPLAPSQLTAVGRRIARDTTQGARRRGFRHVALVFVVLAGGTGAAFAQWTRPGFWHLRGPSIVASHLADAASEGRTAPPRVVVPSENLGPSTLVEPDRAQPDNVQPAPLPQRAPIETPPELTGPSEPAPRQSPIALESEALQKALSKLRRDHDARSALALLDEYDARFPKGSLSIEAAVARVDALLLLGRRDDALASLARLPLDRAGRRIELQLLRAELYAERDCSKALPDFDAVIASSVAPGLEERALYGRAACRLRLGDAAGGKGDLQTYLTRYPAGRFGEQVRARLAQP